VSRGPLPGASRAGFSFPPGEPDMPEFLDDEGRAEWSRMCDLLSEGGQLSKADGAAMAAYCQAWSGLVAASEIVRTEGHIVIEQVQSSKGEVIGEKKKQHPACSLIQSYLSQVRSYLIQFGMTPAARVRAGGVGGDSLGTLAEALNGGSVPNIND
jgi:P27 family predicted phage terminase small subunit